VYFKFSRPLSSLTPPLRCRIAKVEATVAPKPNLENEKGLTIYIGCGNIASQPRKMSSKGKEMLYQKGKEAPENFLATNKLALAE
jgi:formylmethanofuran dehydrogenase subunit B